MTSNFGKYILFVFICFGSMVQAQSDTVTIEGTVKLPGNASIGYLMVANKRTNLGYFGNPNGTFKSTCLRSDTLMISVPGYAIGYVSVKDSTRSKKHFEITVMMERINVNMATHEVKPLRDLEEIQKDLHELGVSRNPEELRTVAAALNSPITYLYQVFSRIEKSKRKLAEYENEDNKIALMKELIAIYDRAGMVDLAPEDVEPFIRHCRFSTTFLKTATQYEIILAVKGKYRTFTRSSDRPGNY